MFNSRVDVVIEQYRRDCRRYGMFLGRIVFVMRRSPLDEEVTT
jgi:hypothetical protein